MQMNRFQALADAFGGDIGRWPAELQRPARALLRSDPEAGRVLALAAEDDRLLDVFPAPQPSLGLRQALIAAAPRPRAGFRFGPAFEWRRLFLPGASLAAAGLAGLVVGAALYSQAVDAAQTDALVDSALIGNATENAAVDEVGSSLSVSVTLPARLA